MRLAEKKLFSRDENDNSDLVQSSPKGKFLPFEKKNTYIGIKTVEDINNMKENFEFSIKIANTITVNSQVSSWFCRTNDRLICPYPVPNVVVPQKCFKGVLLKFYLRLFGDIRSNRK